MLGNLLLKALKTVPPKAVVYKKFKNNFVSDNGVKIPIYETGITIYNASVQPVSTRLYRDLGLNLQNEYRRVFVPANAVALEGQLSSDKFEFDGKEWKSIGNTAWHTYDGWNELIVVGDKTR